MKYISLNLSSKRFEDEFTLENVSLSFPSSGLFLLTGHNGCGKTTILSILAGRDEDYEGSLSVGEVTLVGRKLESYAENEVSYSPQSPLIFEGLSALENVWLPWGRSKCEEARKLLDLFDIGNLAQEKAVNLSAGEKQRVALCRAFCGRRPVVLLDEPTSNLGEDDAAKVYRAIGQMSKERLVIVAESDPDRAAMQNPDGMVKIESGLNAALSSSNQTQSTASDSSSTRFRDRAGMIRASICGALGAILCFLGCFFGTMATSGGRSPFYTDGSQRYYGMDLFFQNADALPYSALEDVEGPVINCFFATEARCFTSSKNPNNIVYCFGNLNLAGMDQESMDAFEISSMKFNLGHLPQAEGEIAVSQSEFDIFLEDYQGPGISEGEAIEECLKDFSISLFGEPFSICGVYDDSPKAEMLKQLGKALDQDGSIYHTSMGAFFLRTSSLIVNSPATLHRTMPGFIAVNSEHNREIYQSSPYLRSIIPVEIAKLLTAGKDGTFPDFLFQADRYFDSYMILEDQGVFGEIQPIFISMLCLYGILVIASPIAGAISDRRKIILLRVGGIGRDKLLKTRLLQDALSNILGIGIGMALGTVACYIYQAYAMGLTVVPGYPFLIFSWQVFVPFVLLALISLALAAAIDCRYLLPYNMSSQLNTIKGKR